MKSVVSILVKRDFYELRNSPRKLVYIIIAAIIPVLSLVSKQPMINDRNNLFLFTLLAVPIYISMESTLSQTIEYIKTGIIELYFVNTQVKKYQIVVAKSLFNMFLSLLAYAITFILAIALKAMGIVSVQITFQLWWVICVLLMGFIASAIGILSATVIKSEKSFCLYIGGMILILLPIFKVLDYFVVSKVLVLILYLAIVASISIVCVSKIYQSNRFISRD